MPCVNSSGFSSANKIEVTTRPDEIKGTHDLLDALSRGYSVLETT
jgi:hypothetical protein